MKQKKINVLKKTLQQKFDQCNDATLVVGQRDFVGGLFILFKLNVKTITVKCSATGKEIDKRYWNEQTKAEAEKLSSQYKISKTGWYVLYSLFTIGILFVLGTIFYAWDTGAKHKETYRGKTNDEKIVLRKKLDTGDLVKTFTGVYKIVSTDNSKIMVKKSNIAVPMSEINELIDQDVFTESTFTSNIIEVNRKSFIKNGMINKKLDDEYGGDPIADILDK